MVATASSVAVIGMSTEYSSTSVARAVSRGHVQSGSMAAPAPQLRVVQVDIRRQEAKHHLQEGNADFEDRLQ
jgi:hypothetical protein